MSEAGILVLEKETRLSLLIACKETGIDVNAEKIKYIFMSREEKVGKNHKIKTGKKSFACVAKFRLLGIK
jgi:hypothetical protein